MEASKRAREGQTPRKTPGKNDFKRPAFALGRISFGVDDDSSSSGGGGSGGGDSGSPVNDDEFRARRMRLGSSWHTPLDAAAPCSRSVKRPGSRVDTGSPLKVGRCSSEPVHSLAGSGPVRSRSILADLSVGVNERFDVDDDRHRQGSPSSGLAVDPASGLNGAAMNRLAPREYLQPRGSLNRPWGTPIVVRKSRHDNTCSGASGSAREGDTGGQSSNNSTGEEIRSVSSRHAGGPAEEGDSEIGSAGSLAREDGEPEAGSYPEWSYYDDDFDTCGVLTYSPSPPRASSPAPPVSTAAASPPLQSTSSRTVVFGTSHKQESVGGSECFDGGGLGEDNAYRVSAKMDNGGPARSRIGRVDHGSEWSGASRSNPWPRGNSALSSDDDRGGGGRVGYGSTRRLKEGRGEGGGGRGGAGRTRYDSESCGKDNEGESSGSSDGDSFSLAAPVKREWANVASTGGNTSTGGYFGSMPSSQVATAGVTAAAAATAAVAGTAHTSLGTVHFGTSAVTTVGEWQREVGGSAWKLEAFGGGGGGGGGGEDGRRLSRNTTTRALAVPSELYDRMYPHQKKGVRWLWGLHQGDMGGILGDDMGLGKTFQVTCLLAGLFRTKQAKCALVLAPKSVMRGWEDELERWLVKACCPQAEVTVMASEMTAKARRQAIAVAAEGGVYGRGAVLVTTYGMVSANPRQFAPQEAGGWIERKGGSRQHEWDYVILDEGHKIKNASTKTCKAVHSLPTKRRLLLTGTPVQNNLKELHTVVDWVTRGKLLGSYKNFKRSFSTPIENGQDRDASEKAVLRSRARAAELRQMLEPLLLQRTKGEIMDEKATTKTEMVVWVGLSARQREIYVKYLGGQSVREILEGKVLSPLAAIAHLKKVCLHPLVSSFPLDQQWYLDSEESIPDLLKDCPKLSVLLNIVRNACNSDHRVLVFSRFVRMLDIIERCLGETKEAGGLDLRLCRIDGGHNDLERQNTIARFNANDEIPVCLVSTGAGGTGITLTGADRVVLFDPSWNPADDMQAVDRAYRIGQKRDVIVYRLIASGTVEEKMYEKQIFKDGLRRTIMGGNVKRKKNVRYFSRAELKQLFTLYPAGNCRVLHQLETMHGPLSDRLEAADSPAQRNISLSGHLDFVCGLTGSYGASAHGDGLPKIVRQAALEASAAGPGCLGGLGMISDWANRGSNARGNQVVEEEDESEVEDMEGSDGGYYSCSDGDMPGRGALKTKDLLGDVKGEDLVAVELDDLDGDLDGDGGGCGPGAPGLGAKASPSARRKGKKPLRSRDRFRLSGDGSDSDNDHDGPLTKTLMDSNMRWGDTKPEVGGTGRDDEMGSLAKSPKDYSKGRGEPKTGRDASSAIDVLSGESDSEFEFDMGFDTVFDGGGGRNSIIKTDRENKVEPLGGGKEHCLHGGPDPVRSPPSDHCVGKIETKPKIEPLDGGSDKIADDDFGGGAASAQTPPSDRRVDYGAANGNPNADSDADVDFDSPELWSMPPFYTAPRSPPSRLDVLSACDTDDGSVNLDDERPGASSTVDGERCSHTNAGDNRRGSGAGGSSGGLESPGRRSRSERKGTERGREQENGGEDLASEVATTGDVPSIHDYTASSPHTSLPPSSPSFTSRDFLNKNADDDGDKEDGSKTSPVVQAERELAKRWPGDQPGVSPAAPLLSRTGGDDGDGGGNGDAAEDKETAAARVGDASEEAARVRDGKSAMEKLIIESEDRRGSCWSSRDEMEDHSETDSIQTVEKEEEEEEEESYHSSHDSLDDFRVHEGDGDEDVKGKGLEQPRTGQEVLDGYALGEAGGGGGGGGGGDGDGDLIGNEEYGDGTGVSSTLVDEVSPPPPLKAFRDDDAGVEGAVFASPIGDIEVLEERSVDGIPFSSLATTRTLDKKGGSSSSSKSTHRLFEGEAGRCSGSTRSSYETAGSMRHENCELPIGLEDETSGGREACCPADDDGERFGMSMHDKSTQRACPPDGTPTAWSSVGTARESILREEKGGGGGCLEDEEIGGNDEAALASSPLPAPPAFDATGGDAGGDGDNRSGSFVIAPATACRAHVLAAKKAGYTCRRCRCAAGAEAAEMARSLLSGAREKEREGDVYQAMSLCLEAVKLCDEDKELHKTIARIGSRMGCLL